jgi:hypothetical protein
MLDDLDGIARIREREQLGDVAAKEKVAVAEQRQPAIAGEMRDEEARQRELGRHRRAGDDVPEAAVADLMRRLYKRFQRRCSRTSGSISMLAAIEACLRSVCAATR